MFKKSCSTLLLAASMTALAADGSLAETREFQKPGTQKGYLLQKFDVYPRMSETPKGTLCDWVMADPGFDLADLRKEGLTLEVGAFASAGLLFANPIVTAFEQSLRLKGIPVARVSAKTGANQAAVAPGPAPAFAQVYREHPQALDAAITYRIKQDAVGTQVELDRYNQDKTTMPLEEAAKRAELRMAERRARFRAEFLGEPAPGDALEAAAAATTPAATPSAETDQPRSPEERPGYQLVFYVTESEERGDVIPAPILQNIPILTNTTTGEFILFKDGKPLLAGRHNSASMGLGGGSGRKSGKALATAFEVKPTRPAPPTRAD